MKFPISAATGLLLICGIAGCPDTANNPSSTPSSATTPPAGQAAIPASQATGIWNQSQVEQWLKQDAKLTELALTSTGTGNYKGTGRNESGMQVQLTVTQVPGGIACDFSGGPGNTGRVTFGNPVTAAGQPAPVQNPVSNSSDVTIPDTPVSGKIHDADFAVEKAVLENGVLTLRQGKDLFPDLALDVMMFIKQGEPAEGKKLRIAPDQAPGKPLLRLQWRDAENKLKTEDFPKNYLLILEFGKIQEGKLPCKIHAVLPDQSKSTISGTFVLEGVR